MVYGNNPPITARLANIRITNCVANSAQLDAQHVTLLTSASPAKKILLTLRGITLVTATLIARRDHMCSIFSQMIEALHKK